MSRKVTIRFNYARRYYAADGDLSDVFTSEVDKEYCVTMKQLGPNDVELTMPNGMKLIFYPPGMSANYVLIREGWNEIDTPSPAPVVPKPPSKPILESTIILEIEPAKHNSLATNTEYLIYKLPRVLNGLLVDRGHVDQETVADRANTEAVGELRGVASFMLTSQNNNLRYRCISFRIDNKTTKKNLTLQYGSGSVCTS